MKRLSYLLAVLVLLVPVVAAELRAQAHDVGAMPLGLDALIPDELRVLERAREPAPWGQVRIEGRVVVRIAPSSDATRSRILNELPRRSMSTAFEEVDHEDCVAITSLVGVHPMGDSRLLLFTDRREVLTASLERNCSADAFYSGFYVDRAGDGQLCASRDRLQSRAGASCQVTSLRQLVAIRD